MSNFFSPFKVGMLLIVSTLSFMFFSVNVRSKLEKEDGNYTAYFHLNDATGLTPKSRVTGIKSSSSYSRPSCSVRTSSPLLYEMKGKRLLKLLTYRFLLCVTG